MPTRLKTTLAKIIKKYLHKHPYVCYNGYLIRLFNFLKGLKMNTQQNNETVMYNNQEATIPMKWTGWDTMDFLVQLYVYY